ncbi:hypothetical protein TRFO_29517 [Tritrichomonas foetus]|uniref:CWH43-like N-terminal domain-containing protein n=1 Tax=Tritrichomonas foetus TaxID=1144522 RepID=A0A1J4K0E2_9EUKA|nr:hypothetical protein TRFO_29517 [Tritrichomonas foetus]|eukprot:OHT03206.1 hypothetical protein TRFO_29517 [Tritrichomonas foetus]
MSFNMRDQNSSTPTKILYFSIFIIPILGSLVCIAIGCQKHHFSPNELPRLSTILRKQPESEIFSWALLLFTILNLIVVSRVFSHFAAIFRFSKSNFKNSVFHTFSLISGIMASLYLAIFSISNLNKAKSHFINDENFFNILITSIYYICNHITNNFSTFSFLFFIFLYFSFCDFMFLSIYRSNYSRKVLIYDIFGISFYLLLFIYDNLFVFVKEKLPRRFNLFGLAQFVSLSEYLLVVLSFCRYLVQYWQIYGQRQIRSTRKMQAKKFDCK